MINKKTKGGLDREFLPRGAAVWIPVALFVLLVLFQMVPLPAGVLKVVSPATYALYEEIGFRVQGSGFRKRGNWNLEEN